MGSTFDTLAITRQMQIDRCKSLNFPYGEFNKTIVSQCDLCGSKILWGTFSIYSASDRYGLPVRSLKCGNCGLIFINPRLTDEAYAEFYDTWYRKLVSAFSGRDSGEDITKRSSEIQAQQVMSFIGKHMPPIDIESMLDIGGSYGIFASKMKTLIGCQATVVDPNKHEVKEASKKGLTTCVSNWIDYKTDKKFDLISMLRTVEHLSGISAALHKVKECLAKDGVFLIDIVNHDWLVKHFHDKSVCTKIDHVYQLTDATIRRYFARHKLNVLGNSDVTERYITYLVQPNE